MENQIYEQLQKIFHDIIFDNAKSMNQKWKELSELWNWIVQKIRNEKNIMIDTPRYIDSDDEVVYFVNEHLREVYKSWWGERIDFLENDVKKMATWIEMIQAKEIVWEICSIKKSGDVIDEEEKSKENHEKDERSIKEIVCMGLFALGVFVVLFLFF